MGVFSLLEFAAKLTAAEADLRRLTPEIIRAACEILCNEAQAMIGIPKAEWPALNPETLARKIANTPLLESGAMQASITYNSDADEGYVGSNDRVLIFQEFGTSRGIPPRPVLGLALMRKEKQIEEMAAKAVMAMLSGLGTTSTQIGEIVRLMKEFGHLAKRIAEEATPETDEERQRSRR